jgi:hypothetical protein
MHTPHRAYARARSDRAIACPAPSAAVIASQLWRMLCGRWQSARIDTALFSADSALYREYLHGEGYTNSFTAFSAFGVGAVDVSKPSADSAWSADRVGKEIKNLRYEGEPRLKLAMTATGRSDPTFWEQCCGQNALLWALLYIILHKDSIAASVFRPIFCRDMGVREHGWNPPEHVHMCRTCAHTACLLPLPLSATMAGDRLRCARRPRRRHRLGAEQHGRGHQALGCAGRPH